MPRICQSYFCESLATQTDMINWWCDEHSPDLKIEKLEARVKNLEERLGVLNV